MASSDDARTRFAAERTLLAWLRTAVALMGFGFVVARFGLFLRQLAAIQHDPAPHSSQWSVVIGSGLLLLGVCVALLAAAEHRRIVQRIDRGEPYEPPRWPLSVMVSVLIAVLGVAMVFYLVVIGH